ncbi:DHS-like NAD/FAD-binding domain-containing protein [Lipomyces arxii]|uniref:DHS-like NAD/FAD-binding domain-containing protein n=1 Tax=Lipomyces arxii TaxID=56418 RepID=UPI0034CE24B9
MSQESIEVQSPAISETLSPVKKSIRRRPSQLSPPKPKTPGPYILSTEDAHDASEYVQTLHHVIRSSKKLVVVVGAGISVQAGIPDFRSSTGVFQSVKNEYKLKGSGQSMFDFSVYKDKETTAIFHSMISSLHNISKGASGTSFHRLLSLLSTEHRLLRLYTQNVDGIELSLTGLDTVVPLPSRAPWPKTIQLHGGLQNMICAKCGWMAPFDPKVFHNDDVPECSECRDLDQVREVVGKRTQGIGRLRPRVVLYNEFNPDGEAIGKVTASDLKSRPDALLVVGTSLKVPGVRRIVKEMAQSVHAAGGVAIWVNIDGPPSVKMFEGLFDLILTGDCQDIPEVLNRKPKSIEPDTPTKKLKSSTTPTPSPTKRLKITSTAVKASKAAATSGLVKPPMSASVKDVFKVKKEILVSVPVKDEK